MGSSGDGRGRPSKVASLVDEYDLEGVGAELEHRWTLADRSERWSLRDLADYFNRQVLERALGDAGVQPIAGEAENVYRLLVDDDVSDADRTRAERRLEREGLDVEELRSQFVSYQAIRTYLSEHRGAEYTPAETDQVRSSLETIQRLRSRTARVAESKVEQRASSGDLSLGETRVTVDVTVFCRDCGRQFDVETLFDRGGCDCPPGE